MAAIFATTFPFFALVLCGYIAVRRHWLPQLAIPGMNAFVLFFGLPCLLYRFGSSTPVAQLFDPGLFGLYLICAVLTLGLAVGLARARGTDWNNAAFGALVAAFPNTGFMGVPLLMALLGQGASGPVIVSLVVDLLFTSSVCIALSRLGSRGSASGSARAGWLALAAVLRNPLPWAMLLGAAASATGIGFPRPVMQSVSMLADAASPVALFTIGAVLARAQMNSDGSGWAEAIPGVAVKLLMHPLLVFGLGWLALRAGMPLDPAGWTVLVFVACLPSANNVAMLAERYGAASGPIARVTLASTAVSFLTFSGAVALFH